MNHDFYTDADTNIPPSICDWNGQVVLALCKRCGKAEGDLTAECSGAAIKVQECTSAEIASKLLANAIDYTLQFKISELENERDALTTELAALRAQEPCAVFLGWNDDGSANLDAACEGPETLGENDCLYLAAGAASEALQSELNKQVALVEKCMVAMNENADRGMAAEKERDALAAELAALRAQNLMARQIILEHGGPVAAPVPPARESSKIPQGYALVPIRTTRAMEEVFEEEGWEWANLLAAAEAITLEEYEEATSEPVREPDWLLKTTQDFACHIAKRCYPEVPQWQVLDDLAGVISQIDNMTTGMERKTPVREPLSESQLREAFGKLYPQDLGLLELSENNRDFALEAIGARHHWTAFKAGARAIEAAHGIKEQK